jgi:PAS domain S-box-containing protein
MVNQDDSGARQVSAQERGYAINLSSESGLMLESLSQELRNIWYALDESAIVVVTDRRGVITHVNRKFCEISGYDHTELIGKTYRLVNSGYHSSEFFAKLWKTISSGRVWEGEIRNRSKSGRLYWVHTTIVPFLNEKGEPTQFVSIRYDVTSRKQIEDKLRVYAERIEQSNFQLKEREHEVRSLLDSTFEGILVHTSEGKLLEWNRAAEEILQRSLVNHECVEALLGGTGWTAWRKLSAPSEGHEIRDLNKALPCVEFQLVLNGGLASDSALIYLELSTKPYPYEGQSVWLTSIRDVSQRKYLEAQVITQDRLASIGLLASSLAHEIGTPLGVIRGRAEILQDSASDNPIVVRGTEIITAQIDRVSKLIRNLLNLARGDVGGQPVSVPVGSSVADVAELMAHEFRKLEIAVRISPEVSRVQVLANAEALQQVLLNLMMNSLHAIETAKKVGRVDGHELRVSVQEQAQRVNLIVEDTGCGISKATLGQIFKPFFTTKDIGKGTGLGLATCFRMIESWGGTIRVESEENQFTRFILSLKKPEPRGEA